MTTNIEKLAINLSNIKTKKLFLSKLDELDEDIFKNLIIFLNEKYRDGEEILSDERYDLIIEYISRLYPYSDILKLIGHKENNSVELEYYLGSQDKAYCNNNNLKKFIEKNNINDYSNLILSAKADGISILYIKKNNIINLFTRGDGRKGTEVNFLLKYIKEFEQYENFKENIVVRGELLLYSQDLDKINKLLNKNYKNTRSIVTGQILKKNPNPDICSKFHFLAHEILNPRYNQKDQFNILKNNNCLTVEYTSITGDLLNNDYLIKLYLEWKNKLLYNIDGIVITESNNIYNLTQDNKTTPTNPYWSIAFKYNTNEKISRVINIEWNLSLHKKFIPIIIIEEVEIDGNKINRVSGKNAKFIKDKKINTNAIIKIVRAGDVIPEIKKVIKESEIDIIFPSNIWKGVDVIYDGNEKLKDITVLEILNFITKFPFEQKYKGIGKSIIEKIVYSVENINNIIDFLNFTPQYINNNTISLGKTMNKKILIIIEKIKNTEINIIDLLSILNIFNGIGKCRLEIIFKNYKNIIDDLKNNNISFDKLVNIHGIDKKITEEIQRGFKLFYDNINIYNKLFKINYSLNEEKEKGDIIYITLSGFRTNKILDDLKKEFNIKETDDLNKSKYLIILDNKTKITNKIKLAKEKNKTILTIEEFKLLLINYDEKI